LLFARLADVPNERRTARYRCIIAIAAPPPLGLYDIVEGTLAGRIARAPRGSGGLRYDPIFYVPEGGRTLGGMRDHQQHQISHRGRAGRAAMARLLRLLT